MKIALCTPTRDGQVHLAHAEAMTKTVLHCLHRGDEPIRLFTKGSSNLPRNRNILVARALKAEADWIVFVDSDVGFNPQDIYKLIEYDRDVIAACPQKRTHYWGAPGQIAVMWDTPDGQTPKPDAKGLYEAAGIATAFMAVKASVFRRLITSGKAKKYAYSGSEEALWDTLANWFWYELTSDVVPPEMREKAKRAGLNPEGVVKDNGEDYYFCHQARDIGIKCWAEADIRLEHYDGGVRHSLNLRDVLNAAAQTDSAKAA